MANPEHLKILKQGVEVWNKSKEENQEIGDNSWEDDLWGADPWEDDFWEADLSDADLSDTNLSYTNLSGADLSDTNLREADLGYTNLSGANLREADLREADLTLADLREAYLSMAQLREANLREANLSGAELSYADLIGADLSMAQLREANLSGAYLNRADLSYTNLSGAYLSEVQMLSTNLEKTTLTGACIKDWHINTKTNLKNIECDYIFLKSSWNEQEEKKDEFTERRPHQQDKIFEPGDFERLVRKSIETIDLIFRNGIDWQAFLNSYEQLKVEAGGDFFPVQSIENRDDGSFIVKLKSPPGTDKEATEKFFEEKYHKILQEKEQQYLKDIEYKDKEVSISITGKSAETAVLESIKEGVKRVIPLAINLLV